MSRTHSIGVALVASALLNLVSPYAAARDGDTRQVAAGN
jgi:hypothetical protein